MAENNPPSPEMVEHHAPRTMYDYAKPSLTGTESSIVRPTIAANNFELKPNTIQMIQQFVQFDGLQDEDPNTHLANFLEFCDTFKINDVSDDAIRLRLFPFSLRNKAKQWLHSLPQGIFHPAKTAKLRNDISSFVQMDSETLYDAWERYKDLLRRCPHHGLPLWLQVQTFYNRVNPSTRQLIDSAAGGTLNNKNPEATYEFIEEMSLNNYQWQVTRTRPAKVAEVFNLDTVELLHKKFDGLYGSSQAHPVMQCDASGGVANPEYPPYGQGTKSEQMNYMVILIIQVGRITPISDGAVKEIKGNNHPKNSNNSPTHKKRIRFQDTETRFQNIETKLEALTQEFKDQIGQLTKLVFETRLENLPREKE
ncbi:Retrotransposon gag protein [Gossypium australe]|uniref:Retrotransposon gag protein n=1 Tax=Gossypium australe TaxID=47621 RepID=A0A5B6VK45_9ROSI|nr:Retrotransposon gag protein [Gossypium australe]